MNNNTILTYAKRQLMLLCAVLFCMVSWTGAWAETVQRTMTFDSSVWGTTSQSYTTTVEWMANGFTLKLTPSSGDNNYNTGVGLEMFYDGTLELQAPSNVNIIAMTIVGEPDAGVALSTSSGTLTDVTEPGNTIKTYSWTGSASAVTFASNAGESDYFKFNSIEVTYEVSLDALGTSTTNGAIYSFNQDPNPFLGVSLYAKTITVGNQEMYFDAFGAYDPMIIQNVDSIVCLHMPAQSRLRLQRSDSFSDIYITKAKFTFVSGSPSISPDGGTYNSDTHTWTGQESQIIFLFNEDTDILMIESEAGLLYNLFITSEGEGSVSFTSSSGSGTVGANNSNSFKVKEGEEVMLTFTPSSDAYKVVGATVNGTNVFDALTADGTYTIPSVTGDLTVYGTFDIGVNNGDVLTEVLDGVEWTFTVTGEGTCNLGGYVPTGDNIPAVPTSTVAESLEIPSMINDYVVNGITVQGFYGCSGLTGTLHIPESVTTIGDQAFMGTNFSGPLTLPAGLTELNSYAFYNLRYLTGDLVIPDGLTVIPAYAFFNCQGFTSLTLPAGVTNLWMGCFGQMSGLTQITCYATTPPVMSAENVFSNYDIPLYVPEESVDAYKTAEYWSNFTKIYGIGTVPGHYVTVVCGANGSISAKVIDLTGTSTEEYVLNSAGEMPINVPDGYTVELTLTPDEGYFLASVMQDDMFNLTGQVTDNVLTLTDITSDMKIITEFLRMQLLLQINSQTDFGSVNWEVTDVLDNNVVTSGSVQNAVDDIPVPYGSTVQLTFNYDHTQYILSQLLRNNADILADVFGDTYTMTNYTAIDTITVNFTQIDQVATPTFSHVGDTVYIACATEGAEIHYSINSDTPDMWYVDGITVGENCTIYALAVKEGYLQSEVAMFTVDWFKCEKPEIAWIDDQMIATTTTDGAIIEYALTQPGVETPLVQGAEASPVKTMVTQDVTITLYAVKTSWANSDTLVVDYPYTSWKALADAIAAANDVLAAAQGNENVTDEQRNELATMIAAAQSSYEARTDSVASINNIANQLAAMSDSISEVVNAVDEPYAVLSESNTKLTFYYDKKKEERGGLKFLEGTGVSWPSSIYGVTRVDFDESFLAFTDYTSTAFWFNGFSSLTTITNIDNLKTDNVTTMANMFAGCISLTSLDLSSFNTVNVTDMRFMFSGCSNLKTIYAGSEWSTASVENSSSMFANCTSLVGGQGTTYDADHIDYTYAHIDGGTQNPGYFSLKLSMGDANGDGYVNIGDAVAAVTNILGEPTAEVFYQYAADMNTDNVIDIFDVTMIVNAAFEAASPAPAMTRGSADNIMTENISMTADADYIYLGIDQPERFTATQFDVTLPEGMELVGVRLASATTDHQLSFVKRGENEYRVIGLSMSNATFCSLNGQLIKLEVSGQAVDSDVKVSNVLFVTPTATVMTSIDKCLNTAKVADDSLYDLKGQRVSKQQLGKGIYIMNHKKVIIK